MHDVPPPHAIVSPAPAAAPWIAAARPWSKDKWLAQHATFVARAKQGGIDVIFLGDSITENFTTRGQGAWQSEIAPLGDVADFGIGGDRTQFVLWRAQHGELAGSGARVVVLMIGTNNLASATPRNIAGGVAAILSTVRAVLPHATIVLNALLPRGYRDDPLRAKLADVNARIATLANGRTIRWLDAGPDFVDADGTLRLELMPDKLHPSAAGYDVWAVALRPVLLDALSK